MAVFLKQCHFQNLPLLSQKSQLTYRNVHCLAPPGKVLLLLCKTKTVWIKRSIHYVILQCYNPRKALKEIPHYLTRDFWYKRSKFWKGHCFRKMALESKRLHQNHWSWYHFAEKGLFYVFMHSLIWSSPWFLWNYLVIVRVLFFLGHPVYRVGIKHEILFLHYFRRQSRSLCVSNLRQVIFSPDLQPINAVVSQWDEFN